MNLRLCSSSFWLASLCRGNANDEDNGYPIHSFVDLRTSESSCHVRIDHLISVLIFIWSNMNLLERRAIFCMIFYTTSGRGVVLGSFTFCIIGSVCDVVWNLTLDFAYNYVASMSTISLTPFTTGKYNKRSYFQNQNILLNIDQKNMQLTFFKKEIYNWNTDQININL